MHPSTAHPLISTIIKINGKFAYYHKAHEEHEA